MSIFPPRAKLRISTDKLCEFKTPAWIAQPKMNGTAMLIISLYGDIITMNRHDKIYQTKIEDAEFSSVFPKHKNFILCGEYLNKAQEDETGQPLRDKFIIWDLIGFDGEDLIGMTLEDRFKLLYANCKKGRKSKKPYLDREITSNISIVKTFSADFDKAYELSEIEVVEGLVLKRKTACLDKFNRSDNNTGWQVKVRKATKCYKM